jgi:DNA-binding response OmpR family regulator
MRPSLPRGRVLLVDEDDKDLKYFTTLLARMGYSFQAFANYREAEGCLEHEHFDFVIVSQGSPAFETQPIVELTLARNRHTPLVVLTRCLHMKWYLEAMQLGAADYLEKNLAPADFEHLVTTHCQPGRVAQRDGAATKRVGAGLALPEGTPRGAPTNGEKCLLKKQELTVLQCSDLKTKGPFSASQRLGGKYGADFPALQGTEGADVTAPPHRQPPDR